jgi:hypothetical protein
MTVPLLLLLLLLLPCQGGCPVNLLQVQYRMHPAIRRFPSQYFYQNSLVGEWRNHWPGQGGRRSLPRFTVSLPCRVTRLSACSVL